MRFLQATARIASGILIAVATSLVYAAEIQFQNGVPCTPNQFSNTGCWLNGVPPGLNDIAIFNTGGLSDVLIFDSSPENLRTIIRDNRPLASRPAPRTHPLAATKAE